MEPNLAIGELHSIEQVQRNMCVHPATPLGGSPPDMGLESCPARDEDRRNCPDNYDAHILGSFVNPCSTPARRQVVEVPCSARHPLSTS